MFFHFNVTLGYFLLKLPPLHLPLKCLFFKIIHNSDGKETKQVIEGNCKPKAHRLNEPPALATVVATACRCCGVLLGISVGMKVVCIKFSRMFTVGKVFPLVVFIVQLFLSEWDVL